jgi:hypothetical protein
MHSAGLLAATLIALCVLPRVFEVLRSRDVTGVSVTGAAHACVSCAAWTAYAVGQGMALAATSSAVGTDDRVGGCVWRSDGPGHRPARRGIHEHRATGVRRAAGHRWHLGDARPAALEDD